MKYVIYTCLVFAYILCLFGVANAAYNQDLFRVMVFLIGSYGAAITTIAYIKEVNK